MFGFIEKKLFTVMTFSTFNPLIVNYLGCVSVNNQQCQTRTKIVSISNNELAFYPFCIKVNKSSGSCNNILMILMLNCVFLMLLKT